MHITTIVLELAKNILNYAASVLTELFLLINLLAERSLLSSRHAEIFK